MEIERLAGGVVWAAASLRDAVARAPSLPEEERARARAMRLEARRRTFLAGRVAAHAAVREMPGADGCVIRAADDGAPEAWCDGTRLDISISIAHRGDRVIAAAAALPLVVGCDLERIEPRSEAFVADYLTGDEAAWVNASGARDVAANLAWSVKEAVLKVRRTGLRRDTRTVEVRFEGRLDTAHSSTPWRPVRVVDRIDPAPVEATWRTDDGYVLVLATSRPAP